MQTTEFDGKKVLLLNDDDVRRCQHCAKSDYDKVNTEGYDIILRISESSGSIWPLKNVFSKKRKEYNDRR